MPTATVQSSSFDGMVAAGAPPATVRGDSRVRLWFLMSPNLAGSDLSLGHLAVRWCHCNSTDEVTTLLPLPRVKIQRTPFSAVTGASLHQPLACVCKW